MPEVTGTISDPIRQMSYILKMAGSPAAEVFAFHAKQRYDSVDVLDLGMLPTLKCPTNTGSTDDSKKGKYVTSNLKLWHVLMKDGVRICPKSKVKFNIQATLEINDANEMEVTGYLRNGEMLMRRKDPQNDVKDTFIYNFSPILVGEVDDLATPLGLALLKERLKDAGVVVDGYPEVERRSPTITFEPASDDSAQASSLDSTSSLASSILAGTFSTGHTSAASRIRCGQKVERSLERALVSGLEQNFAPWMTSTGTTPPSGRPTSSQSLPTDIEGSGSSGSSPQRPRSTSPTKGRKRKKTVDKTYKQPGIRGFLTPSPPTSPNSGRNPLPARVKRRSQRQPPSEQPAPKKQAMGEERPTVDHDQLTKTPPKVQRNDEVEDTAEIEEISLDDPIPDSSVEYIGHVDRSKPITIDLSNDITPDQDVIVTPPASTSSSKEASIVPYSRHGARTDDNPSPGSSTKRLTKAKVTLHTNLPIVQRPHHVFVKARRDHLSVKFLTFPAYNLEDIVRAFFREEHEHDNPEELQGMDEIEEISLEDLLTPEASLEESSTITTKTENFSSTDIQTFTKTYSPVESPAEVAVDNSVIEVSLGYDVQVENTGAGIDEQDQDMAVARDMSLIIQDVCTAGDDTLDQEDEAAPEHIVIKEEDEEGDTQEEDEEEEH